MGRSRIVAAVVIATVGVYALILLGTGTDAPPPVFHATLADASLYGPDGVFDVVVEAEAGEYELRFVPNGDSPHTLGVSIVGGETLFDEMFELRGTRRGGEAVEYYTWEYLGKKNVTITADAQLDIRIDPYGNLLGPVSVTLVPK